MKIPIRDNQQRPICYVDDSGNVVRLYDKYGSKLLGNYNKSSNETYSVNGRLIGRGNQLLTLIQ
jgi:hypothetical protein